MTEERNKLTYRSVPEALEFVATKSRLREYRPSERLIVCWAIAREMPLLVDSRIRFNFGTQTRRNFGRRRGWIHAIDGGRRARNA